MYIYVCVYHAPLSFKTVNHPNKDGLFCNCNIVIRFRNMNINAVLFHLLPYSGNVLFHSLKDPV